MSRTPTTKHRTKISMKWRPSPVDRAYAEQVGVGDIAAVADEFRDYHLARGSLMNNWDAAWRTWCRNMRKWGQTKKAKAPLFSGLPDPDPYGALGFAQKCRYAEPGTIESGKVVPCVGGWDLVGVLLEVCEVARLPEEWRGDLSAIVDWLREGLEPERIIDAVRSHKPSNDPGQWWWYERAVRKSASASK
jgi:hypothetical protein